MIGEIRRFNHQAKADFVNNTIDSAMTMGDYLDAGQYSDEFRQYYILPMASAIWSMPRKTINSFQAHFFIRFFQLHGLLNITNRPQWQVIEGGSREYIGPLTASYSSRIRTDCEVLGIERTKSHVQITTRQGHEKFDLCVFACHSDQALKILGVTATNEERQILGGIKYCSSDVIVHTDTNLLPKTRRARASWNYLLNGQGNDVPMVTYNMNILQGLTCDTTFCVSLNAGSEVSADKVIQTFKYSHPKLNANSIAAQQRFSEINGENRSWFCGAYWGNGFHEDGVVSAHRVVNSIEKQSCQRTYSTAA